MEEKELLELICQQAHPLSDDAQTYDPLLEQIGSARFVLLGEASHGTHEFYEARVAITKRLIEEQGCLAVVAEADWPDAARVHRFAQSRGTDRDSIAALAGFKRFPAWMWRNTVMVEFVDWLRAHNQRVSPDRRVGFYGMDLYSLHASIEAVLTYLGRVDPEAAARARHRYGCFDSFGGDPQAYGYAAASGTAETCEQQVVNQLVELQRREAEILSHDGQTASDEFFFAEQNALLIKNAEAYYRSMFRGRVSSWNLRDRHMVESLGSLVSHLDQQRAGTRVVVWAHNSHLGDARATEMGRRGEWNVGQLVRERFGQQVILVGFSTCHGTVTAASGWGEPAERKRVQPALSGSYEALFHSAGPKRFLLNLRSPGPLRAALRESRLQRAIGVIYRPETERWSHYLQASLSEQFDAVLHFDETRAVEPLERTAGWEVGELPETYPSGV